jgi:two-component sensor histidine kinase
MTGICEKSKLRLLIVEDSEDDALLLLRELRRGNYEVSFVRVDTPSAMLIALKKTWDLVVCDYSMPQFNALDALKLLQENELDLPFIIVSGTIGEDVAVAAMKAGAHDYIIKGNLARLIPAVDRELREVKVRQERKKAQEQIKASLREKEILLKEIHHRVKNNLQIISSLLNLQAEYLKDTQTIAIFKDSQNRIQSMAIVHEKLYQSEDLATINLSDYIQDLVSNLSYSYEVNLESIVFKIDVEDVLLDIDTAIPCGLIINELISNSLKYAFPRGKSGEIWIKLKSSAKNQLRLIVSDNGMGLPENFDFNNTESLGLQLVDALTIQLKGTIEIDRARGTKFLITFPYK